MFSFENQLERSRWHLPMTQTNPELHLQAGDQWESRGRAAQSLAFISTMDQTGWSIFRKWSQPQGTPLGTALPWVRCGDSLWGAISLCCLPKGIRSHLLRKRRWEDKITRVQNEYLPHKGTGLLCSLQGSPAPIWGKDSSQPSPHKQVINASAFPALPWFFINCFQSHRYKTVAANYRITEFITQESCCSACSQKLCQPLPQLIRPSLFCWFLTPFQANLRASLLALLHIFSFSREISHSSDFAVR